MGYITAYFLVSHMSQHKHFITCLISDYGKRARITKDTTLYQSTVLDLRLKNELIQTIIIVIGVVDHRDIKEKRRGPWDERWKGNPGFELHFVEF